MLTHQLNTIYTLQSNKYVPAIGAKALRVLLLVYLRYSGQHLALYKNYTHNKLASGNLYAALG
jgi:hypothetical protein